MGVKVLMFGWEFPPYKTGGLGTACYGLTKALSKRNLDITFVIPTAPKPVKAEYVNLLIANRFALKRLHEIRFSSFLSPYLTPESYARLVLHEGDSKGFQANYGWDLFSEVERYAEFARLIAKNRRFDLIHAHDWMCAKAGLAAKEVSGKPLIVHIHATEFDRTAGHPNPRIYAIEKEAMEKADKIIAVSNFTKSMITRHYGIPPNKIEVVYNAVEFGDEPSHSDSEMPSIHWGDKVVLFLGRVTVQKGPGYFLEAAKRVLELDPSVKFVIAGDGDMLHSMVEKAAAMGISRNVIFAGFLRGKEVDAAYRMASVYVMPSVSEPFGISPLEAMRNRTPVIISKQSGVSEVIRHCLKVDFWDVEELVNKLMGVLNYKSLRQTISRQGYEEVMRISWDDSAAACQRVYNMVV